MIVAWMAYCLAVSVLAGLGALALERVLAGRRRPLRWAWLGALAASAALPAAAAVSAGTAPGPRVQAPAAVSPDVEAAAAAPAAGAAGEPVRSPAPNLAALDRPLLLAWGAASAGVLAWAGMAVLALSMRRRRWRAEVVDGVPVLVAPDAGPAVVGLVRGAIVLPEWVVREADEASRALMLAHEREHLRAGDPRLLLAALAVVGLAPWNPAFWWQLRRLRVAIEVDCDARVLAWRGDVRAYGRLLLEVGRRGAAGGLGAAAAFSEPASFLERRIRAMTVRARMPRPRAAALGCAAALLAAAACGVPRPDRIPAPGLVARAEGATDPRELRRLVERHFPGVLERGLGGKAGLGLVLDGRGRVLQAEYIDGFGPGGPRVGVDRAGPVEGSPGESRSFMVIPAFGVPLDRPLSVLEQVDSDHIVSRETAALGDRRPGRGPVYVVVTRLKGTLAEGRAAAEERRRREAAAPPAPRREAGALRTPAERASDEQMERMRGAARAALEEHHPRAVREGLPADRRIWFLVDARGRVVRTGTDPENPFTHGVEPDQLEMTHMLSARQLGLPPGTGTVFWMRLKA